MKRIAPLALALIGIALVILFRQGSGPAVNPDPNHTHTDFAVYVNGEKLDFTDARYMSEVYDENGAQMRLDARRKYLHLHDGIGHVIHRHKPGLTLGEFFDSLGIAWTDACITLDAFQYEALDEGWKDSFAIEPRLCDNGKFRWTMYVNGAAVPVNAAYAFADGDQILLTYGASDVHDDLIESLTDDACLYSRTCPERGEPPAENCIADPEVPCVLPE